MTGPLVLLKQVLGRGRQTFLIKDADGGTASRKRGPAGAFGEGIPGGTALIRSRAVGGLPGSGISRVLYPFSAPSSPPRRWGVHELRPGRTLRRAPILREARTAPLMSGPSVRPAPPHPRLRLRSGPLRVRAFAPVRSASSVSGPPPRPPTTVNVDGQCTGQGTGLGPAALGGSESVLCVLASERASLPPSRQSPIIPSPSLRGAGLVPAHPGENDLCLGKPAVFPSLGGSAFAVRVLQRAVPGDFLCGLLPYGLCALPCVDRACGHAPSTSQR